MKYAKFLGIAAAAILLCGCADNDDDVTSIPTTHQSSSTSSSSSVDPLVSSIMSDLDISLPEGGTSYFSQSSFKSKSTINKKVTYGADKTYPVHNKQLILKDGGEMTIEGKLDATEGSKITIQKGGALILNGESALNCDLYIEDGGKLVVGENGKVSGSGTIYAFSNDCIENSKNIENSIKVTG